MGSRGGSENDVVYQGTVNECGGEEKVKQQKVYNCLRYVKSGGEKRGRGGGKGLSSWRKRKRYVYGDGRKKKDLVKRGKNRAMECQRW